MGIQPVLAAPRSPWQPAHFERLIGSLRRECLEHLIVFNQSSLSRHLQAYADYYHRTRTHLARPEKIVPNHARYKRKLPVRLSRARRSVVFTIVTSAGLPENQSQGSNTGRLKFRRLSDFFLIDLPELTEVSCSGNLEQQLITVAANRVLEMARPTDRQIVRGPFPCPA
jgi:hypothetical protein